MADAGPRLLITVGAPRSLQASGLSLPPILSGCFRFLCSALSTGTNARFTNMSSVTLEEARFYAWAPSPCL